MPDYDYECTNKDCKNQFTVTQGMNDVHEGTCPSCKSEGKRIYSATNTVWNCGGAFGKSNK